jgi:type II secretory pathway pseudopilin PulG
VRICSRAFTLIDVLVSITVIGILIGILLPSLAGVTSSARRVACTSNIRQLGLGLYMYADDFRGLLAPSINVPSHANEGGMPQEMMMIRYADPSKALPFANSWDGLGLLYSGEYLTAPKIFYCPAHRGQHPFTKYALSFGFSPKSVLSNYHYRGKGPSPGNAKLLHQIIPSDAALIADGMRTKADYNHRGGLNVLRADQGVVWYDDLDNSLFSSLPDDDVYGTDASTITEAWGVLDATALRR